MGQTIVTLAVIRNDDMSIYIQADMGEYSRRDCRGLLMHEVPTEAAKVIEALFADVALGHALSQPAERKE